MRCTTSATAWLSWGGKPGLDFRARIGIGVSCSGLRKGAKPDAAQAQSPTRPAILQGLKGGFGKAENASLVGPAAIWCLPGRAVGLGGCGPKAAGGKKGLILAKRRAT